MVDTVFASLQNFQRSTACIYVFAMPYHDIPRWYPGIDYDAAATLHQRLTTLLLRGGTPDDGMCHVVERLRCCRETAKVIQSHEQV